MGTWGGSGADCIGNEKPMMVGVPGDRNCVIVWDGSQRLKGS